MADLANADAAQSETLKESPTPQESPGVSTTPDAEADGKVKKARTTVILREVDPAATEEEILALFQATELKVLSAREDVQNTWFVNMETEDMAKQAIQHLGNQVLCGKPVKARIKSEGTLRTTAPAWQPSPNSRTAQALFMNAGVFQPPATFQAPVAAPGAPVYKNWSSARPASVSRPPQGGEFKKLPSTAGDVHGGTNVGNEHQVSQEQSQSSNASQSGKPLRKGMPAQKQARSQGDRNNRKGGNQGGASAPSKAASFQPQDFPTLGGAAPSPSPPADVLPAPLPVAEAPANSWAARAKTIAEAPPAVSQPKKASPAPEAKPAKERKKEVVAPEQQERQHPQPEAPLAVEPKAQEPAQEMKIPGDQTSPAEAASNEVKRRGWEKPGLPQPKKEVVSETSSVPQSVSTEKEPVKEAQGEKNEKSEKAKKQSSGKRKEKSDTNGHASQPSPIVPLSWGTKSFAQVIKEKAPVAPAANTTATPPVSTSVLGSIPALKSNENWGDVEDDEPQASSTSRTAGGRSATAGLEKLRPSSESSSDWRRDAAARRKEEQSRTPTPPTTATRRPNGASS